MEVEHKQRSVLYQEPGIREWLIWVFRVSLAGSTGSAIAACMALFSWGAGLLFFGTIIGFSLASAQSNLLSRFLPDRDWSKWVRYSIIGATLGWALTIVMRFLVDRQVTFHPLFSIIAFLVVGTLFGSAQWVTFRQIANAHWWIIANCMGWSVGAYLGVNIAQVIAPFDTDTIIFGPYHAVYVLIAGIIGSVTFSIVTGSAIAGYWQGHKASLSGF
jgi:hypothetical protein